MSGYVGQAGRAQSGSNHPFSLLDLYHKSPDSGERQHIDATRRARGLGLWGFRAEGAALALGTSVQRFGVDGLALGFGFHDRGWVGEAPARSACLLHLRQRFLVLHWFEALVLRVNGLLKGLLDTGFGVEGVFGVWGLGFRV